MLKLICLILILTNSAASFSQSLINENREVSKIDLSVIPAYFFKIKGNLEYLSYSISGRGNEQNNYIKDLVTGNVVSILGPWDPVFLNQTNLMVLPMSSNSGKTYGLYDLPSMLEQSDDSFIGKLEGLNGLYQSVGVIEQDAEKIIFRVMVDARSGYQVADYSFNRELKKVELIQRAKLCSNVEGYLKLPMLSKDGSHIGVYNVNRNSSIVYEVLDDLSCQEVVDLGIGTGKINFNYLNDRLTFHIYAADKNSRQSSEISGRSNYIKTPKGALFSNIYTYDMTNGQFFKITNNDTSVKSMYPDFSIDGKIIFVNYKSSGGDSAISHVDFSVVEENVYATPFSILKGDEDRFDPSISNSELETKVTDIINNSCVRCHSSAHPSAGVALDNGENLLKKNSRGEFIILDAIEYGGMPLGSVLPDSDIEYMKLFYSRN